MKPLFLAAALVFVFAAGLAGCQTPTATDTSTPEATTPPTSPCAALEAIADGSSTAPLKDAAVDLFLYMANSGRPCAVSYREYADNIDQASPPLSPDEVLYYAGQLAWACRADTTGEGCTGPTYANPPVDPGGHMVDLLDGNGPHFTPDPATTAQLMELPGWTVLPVGTPAPGSQQCYSALNQDRPKNAMNTPDWTLVPTVDATTAPGVPANIPSNAVPANPTNPYRVLAPDGLYGWQVNADPAKCYFVAVRKLGQVRISPAVGVWPNQPVSDLNFCRETSKWYSDIHAPCP